MDFPINYIDLKLVFSAEYFEMVTWEVCLNFGEFIWIDPTAKKQEQSDLTEISGKSVGGVHAPFSQDNAIKLLHINDGSLYTGQC